MKVKSVFAQSILKTKITNFHERGSCSLVQSRVNHVLIVTFPLGNRFKNGGRRWNSGSLVTGGGSAEEAKIYNIYITLKKKYPKTVQQPKNKP